MADVYKFKTRKGKKIEVKPPRDMEFHVEEEVIGLINGQIPGSELEYRISKALDMLKFEYKFQVPVGGGRLFRGGYVLDFLVYTHPLPTPLEALGDYWHGGTADDTSLRFANIKRIMGSSVNDPVGIWEHEARTISDAYKNLKRKLILISRKLVRSIIVH